MEATPLQFWFEYGSTYSYLSVMRVEDAAEAAGLSVDWRPFLLMPILKAQGMDQGPFLPFPAKQAYMWRDLQRRARRFGIPYNRPSIYPPNTLLTARVGLLAAREGWCAEFSKAVFTQHWVHDVTIGSEENLKQSLRKVGRNAEETINQAISDENKNALREQTEMAADLGIFGAPNFVVEDQLFWGDDRLEEAVAWAIRG